MACRASFPQALFVSLAVVAHTASQFALIESTELPQTTGSLRSSLAEFVSLLTMAIRCRRFAVEGTLYAAMAGISMAVPAVQDDILERAGMAQVCNWNVVSAWSEVVGRSQSPHSTNTDSFRTITVSLVLLPLNTVAPT